MGGGRVALPGRVVCLICSVAGLLVLGVFVHLQDQIDKLHNSQKRVENYIGKPELRDERSIVGHLSRRLKKPVLGHGDRKRNKSGGGAASLSENLVMFYNRIPKTGSTSFAGVAYELCGPLKYHVIHVNVTNNAPVMSLSDQMRLVQNVTDWNAVKPVIYHGHQAFLNFERFGARNPLYINIIRQPLDRLVSYFYFIRFGDDFRPHLKRRKMGDKMTFDECVEQGHKDCDPSHMWLQIPFFCGMDASCWEVGSEWALERAKENVVRHYFLVGVTEHLEEMVQVVEAALPRFFTGATHLFLHGEKAHLRRTRNKRAPLASTVSKVQESRVWQLEDDFYQFVLRQFLFVRDKTVVPAAAGAASSSLRAGALERGHNKRTNSNDASAPVEGQKTLLVDRGHNFHYEKIRPRTL